MSKHLKRVSKKLKAAASIGDLDPNDEEVERAIENIAQELGDCEALGFVRLPKPVYLDDFPQAQLQTHAMAEAGEIQGAMFSIEAAMHRFREEGCPITALRIFCDSMESGFYPPTEILEFLHSSFNDYFENEGTVSMDKAMHLAAGKGQTPPFKRSLMRQRDEMLMMDIDLLMVLGFSREKAAEAVTTKLAAEDWNKSLHDMADIDADTIADRHKRAYRPQLEDVEFTKKMYRLNTDEGVRDYLSRFPGLTKE